MIDQIKERHKNQLIDFIAVGLQSSNAKISRFIEGLQKSGFNSIFMLDIADGYSSVVNKISSLNKKTTCRPNIVVSSNTEFINSNMRIYAISKLSGSKFNSTAFYLNKLVVDLDLDIVRI